MLPGLLSWLVKDDVPTDPSQQQHIAREIAIWWRWARESVMKIIYSDRHRLHRGDKEMYRGELVPCFEKPERADYVYDAVTSRNIGPILEPKEFRWRRSNACMRRATSVFWRRRGTCGARRRHA